MKSGDYCPDIGDLIWIDLDPTVGHEQSGRRPALVLTAHEYNKAAGLCVACPITNRARGYPFEVAITPGLPVAGVVLADQARSVSWEKRFIQPIGQAPASLVIEVCERLAVLLGID